MTTIHWFILIGCLMLARGLAATTISRSPFTSAIVYLFVGLLLGPVALGIFRFNPIEESHLLEVLTEIAVWSGDTVKKDEDGFLYFVSRRDEMIKTSGYRVSPTEVENCLLTHDAVRECAVVGVERDGLMTTVAFVATAALWLAVLSALGW